MQTIYLALEDEKMLDLLASQYIAVINKNNDILERKTFAVRVGMVMLFTAILILTVLQFFVS